MDGKAAVFSKTMNALFLLVAGNIVVWFATHGIVLDVETVALVLANIASGALGAYGRVKADTPITHVLPVENPLEPK